MKYEKMNIYKWASFILFILIILVLYQKYNLFSHDKLIAKVNGEKVYLSEFEATYRSMILTNNNINKEDVLRLILEQKVLVSEAKKLGITVSNSEFSQYLNQYLDQVGGEENFKRTLQELDISESLFYKLLKEQIYIRKLFEQYYFPKVNVSDKEVDEFIEMTLGSKEAVNESTRELIKDALLAQKRIDFIQEKVNDLLSNAEIKIYGDFDISLLNISSKKTKSPFVMKKGQLKESKKNKEEIPSQQDNQDVNITNVNNTLRDTKQKTVKQRLNNQSFAIMKECIKKKLLKNISLFILCNDDDCDFFERFINKSALYNVTYITRPSSAAIEIIDDCLSSLYKGYVPEVICINNGKILYDNFNTELSNFIKQCV